MDITVDTSDIERFAREMERMPNELRPRLVEAIHKGSEMGIRTAKAWAPVGETGNLRRGIEELPIWGTSGRAGISGGFTSPEFYSWFLEAGTASIAPIGFMMKGRNAAEGVFEDAVEDALDEVTR